MDSYQSSAKTRITGALMQNYTQKAVTLMGDIVKVESDGKRATMKTTDDQFVQILFAQPIMTSLNIQCLTEVYGIVLSRNQIQCHDWMQFPTDMSDKFDRNTYNEFITEFIKTCDQHINCMVESNEDNSVINPIDNFSMNTINESNNHNMSFDLN